MVRQALGSGGKGGIAGERLAPLPAARRIAADRRIGILAQRGRECAFIAGLGPKTGDRRAPSIVERSGKRVALGPCRRQRCACRCKPAFRLISLFGGLGTTALGLKAAALRLAERIGGGLRPRFGFLFRPRRVDAVAESAQLFGKPLLLLFASHELRLGRFERSFGDPALGLHRRLAREQLGERGFGLA